MRGWLRGHHMALLWWAVAWGTAAVAPVVLRRMGLLIPLDDGLAALNFDADRVALIDHTLAALLGGACGALLWQRRGAACLGGIAYYVSAYLLPYIRATQHPGLSPAGLPQTLDLVAFRSTVLTLLALGVTFAAIGAILGGALGEIVLIPMANITHRLWRAAQYRSFPRFRTLARPTGVLLAGLLLIAAFSVAAHGVGDVMNYGPVTTIYQSVLPQNKHGGLTSLPHGTVMRDTFASPALGGMLRRFYIYLPPSYSKQPTKRYPTIYLLHGGPGDPHNWMGAAQAPTTVDALVARHQMREVILVSPDGNGPVYRFSKWANSFDGKQRMEDSVVSDLVFVVDTHYRTLADPADRAIVGLSDGGYGAVNIALHHPSIFGAAVSEGGYFDAEGPIFGTGPTGAQFRLYNSPAHYIDTPAGIAAARQLTFVICIGTSDGRFYADGLTFMRDLQRIGAHVTLIESSGGHSWTDWAQMFGQAAPLIEPTPRPRAQ